MRKNALTWYRSGDCMCVDQGLNSSGYPRRMIKSKRMEVCRMILARRFERLGLVLTSDIQSRHTCDNRRCVNPAHITHGSMADNQRDKIKRNRQSRMFGEHHPLHKLTDADVSYIRSSNKTLSVLSDELQVSPQTIWSARTQRTWKS